MMCCCSLEGSNQHFQLDGNSSWRRPGKEDRNWASPGKGRVPPELCSIKKPQSPTAAVREARSVS